MPEFPDAVWTTDNPTEFDQTNSGTVPLATQLSELNDEVTAIEDFLLSGTPPSGGADFRFKSVGGVLQLQVYNPAGGGTPWHRVYPIAVDSVITLAVDDTGQAE